MRWVSSQARRRGPSVAERGDGSRIIRCREPALDCGGMGELAAGLVV